MQQRFGALVLMYLRSSFSFSLPSRAELKKPKVLLKTLGIGLGVLAIMADIGFVFVMMDLGMYKALAPAGMQSLVLLNAATTAAVLVFVLAFLMALSMFSTSGTDSGFLSLPIPPRELLAGKMILVYVTDAALGLFVMAVSLVVYGIKEGPGLLFYLDGIVDALALPLLPIAITYLILVPAVKSSKLFRNKNFILYFGGFLGLVIALAFNIYMQRTMSHLGDAAGMAALVSPESLASRMGRAWLPSWLTWKSLTGVGSIVGPLSSLAGLALGLGSCLLVASFLGPSYVGSLAAFGESTAKRGKIALGGSAGGGTFTRRQPAYSLVSREFLLMQREPMYFLNGPFVVVLMPVIMAIMYFAQRETLRQALGGLAPLLGGPAGYLIPAAFGAFLGCSTSITCTSVSRDAKFLPWMRSLPVSPEAYFGAKLIHAEFFSVFGAAVGVGAGAILFGTGALDAAIAAILALGFSTALNMIGLWLDTAWPRLSWDNPIAALKQNPNAIVVILGAIGLLGGMGALTAALKLPRYGYALLYGAVVAVPIALWTALFPKFAARRYRELGE
jgi:ABC-2 type transport system permease protein